MNTDEYLRNIWQQMEPTDKNILLKIGFDPKKKKVRSHASDHTEANNDTKRKTA